jgi:hypothetical protein
MHQSTIHNVTMHFLPRMCKVIVVSYCRQYGEDPRRALWKWTRSAARTLSCCSVDCTLQPKAAVSTSASAADLPKVSESDELSAAAEARAATQLQSDIDTRHAPCYLPMAQRAMVLRSKINIRTAGGEYEASAHHLLAQQCQPYTQKTFRKCATMLLNPSAMHVSGAHSAT